MPNNKKTTLQAAAVPSAKTTLEEQVSRASRNKERAKERKAAEAERTKQRLACATAAQKAKASKAAGASVPVVAATAKESEATLDVVTNSPAPGVVDAAQGPGDDMQTDKGKASSVAVDAAAPNVEEESPGSVAADEAAPTEGKESSGLVVADAVAPTEGKGSSGQAPADAVASPAQDEKVAGVERGEASTETLGAG